MKKRLLAGLGAFGWTFTMVGWALATPLMPFSSTSDLYVMDEEQDAIIKIDSGGSVTVVVTQAEIAAVTGESGADFADAPVRNGLAFDEAGNMFFSDSESDSILVKRINGTLEVLATETAMEAAVSSAYSSSGYGNQSPDVDPSTLAFGSDGQLYVNDADSDAVFRISTSDGSVSVLALEESIEATIGNKDVELRSGIVGSADGKIYSLSDGRGGDQALFAIDTGTGSVDNIFLNNADGFTFEDLSSFMTIAPNGDLIFADDNGADPNHDRLYRYSISTGMVSNFLTEAQLEGVTGGDVELEAGFAFDSAGNFFLADENDDSIYTWDVSSLSLGTIDYASGSLWISQAEILAQVNSKYGYGWTNLDFEAAVAFSPGAAPVPEPATMLLLGTGLVGLVGSRGRRKRKK